MILWCADLSNILCVTAPSTWRLADVQNPILSPFFLVSWFAHYKFKGGYSWFETFLLRKRAIFISEGQRRSCDHLVPWRAVFSNSSGPYVVRGTWIKFHCCMPIADCLLFLLCAIFFSPFRGDKTLLDSIKTWVCFNVFRNWIALRWKLEWELSLIFFNYVLLNKSYWTTVS